MIAKPAQLQKLLPKIEAADRVAVDTEADSLHCYREKLCLLQISLSVRDHVGWIERSARDVNSAAEGALVDSGSVTAGGLWSGQPIRDYIVDPLAGLDLGPLCAGLAKKEIVLHGADFDLRLLRRSLDLAPKQVFDTVIAARLLGIHEFSLVALVERYFGIRLTKGSQRANWGRRPLPVRMEEYAMNDTHYLLPLADLLETELDRLGVGEHSAFRLCSSVLVSRCR